MVSMGWRDCDEIEVLSFGASNAEEQQPARAVADESLDGDLSGSAQLEAVIASFAIGFADCLSDRDAGGLRWRCTLLVQRLRECRSASVVFEHAVVKIEGAAVRWHMETRGHDAHEGCQAAWRVLPFARGES